MNYQKKIQFNRQNSGQAHYGGKILILLTIFLFSSGVVNNPFPARAAASPDAIAVRVIPNPSHYSPSYWYKNNIKVQGAPQASIIDGYEAVRDGRTVYVNGANLSGSAVYTNIYIISYNQDAEPSTIDIFGQILSHWKFNVNLGQSGKCSKNASLGCLNYNDCPANEYCLSKKSQVIRDVKRLSDLAQIKIALNQYRDKNNSFPALSAGSYLAQKTISVWPSWQDSLARALGVVLPLDPINFLGACTGEYDKTTCWDAKNKKYSQAAAGNQMPLPAGSYAYSYSTDPGGSDFNLCAATESGFLPNNVCLAK